MRILDLFCGAGGASMGYHRAGFDVVGVDIKPQPRYPFDFVQDDAIVCLERGWAGLFVEEFDAIHASPPCQAYTSAKSIRGNEHPDLVGPVRDLLDRTGLPYIIENVKGSPLRNPVCIEGQMFPELRVVRPRYFEANWPLSVPLLRYGRPRVADLGRAPEGDQWPQVVGHAPDADGNRKAMGIDWMNRDELAQAIPPAYTEFIGRQLLEHIASSKAEENLT